MYNSDRCTCRAKFPFFFGNPVRTKTIDLSKSINHRAIDFGSMSVHSLRRNTMYSSPSGSTGDCRVQQPIHTATAESYSPTPGTYGGCRVLHPIQSPVQLTLTMYGYSLYTLCLEISSCTTSFKNWYRLNVSHCLKTGSMLVHAESRPPPPNLHPKFFSTSYPPPSPSPGKRYLNYFSNQRSDESYMYQRDEHEKNQLIFPKFCFESREYQYIIITMHLCSETIELRKLDRERAMVNDLGMAIISIDQGCLYLNH